MQHIDQQPQSERAGTQPTRAYYRGLEGVSGAMRIEAPQGPLGPVGTVWPHDNSLIAWGLEQYGYREEAARIALATLKAATLFHDRLPEAFAGYERARTKYPVEYPTACSPQAWATATPLLLIRTLLGLESDGRHLLVDPAVPEPPGRIALLDIRGPWGKIDAFGRGRRMETYAPRAA